jgi:AraC-like DNA-binding protein
MARCEPRPYWADTGLRSQTLGGLVVGVALAGRVRLRVGERGRQHCHDFWELLLPVDGELDLLGPGGDRPLPGGTAALVPPGLPHTVRTRGRRALDLLYAGLSCSVPPPAEVRITALTADDARLLHLRTLMAKRPSTPDDWSALAGEAAFLQALLAVVADHLPGAAGPRSPHDRLIEQACRLLAARLDRDLRIGEVATDLCVHPDRLAAVFRARTGQTLKAWHRTHRLEEARRRLRDGAASVSAVAQDLGFTSLQRFSREFRRAYAVGPSALLRCGGPRQDGRDR